MIRVIGCRFLGALAIVFACVVYAYLTLPDVRTLKNTNPPTTAFIEFSFRQARAKGQTLRRVQQWVSYRRISQDLKRSVLVA